MNLEEFNHQLNFISFSNQCKILSYKDQKEAKERLENLFKEGNNHYNFSKRDFRIFSSPGRTELAGNHTDHNNGKVLAASINLDTLSIVSKRDDKLVNCYSKNLNEALSINLENLEKRDEEINKTESLIRGIARYLIERNYEINGFDIYLESRVLMGSGLSSSASIEVLFAKIFCSLAGEKNTDPTFLSKAGKWAENNYFGKPCGLMDQLACAWGGIISIDFKDPDNPEIEKLDANFSKAGFLISIVNTKGDHADLTEEYSAVRREMIEIAQYFDKEVLRDISWEEINNNIKKARNKINDRAFLRAYHFYNENERVAKMLKCLKQADISEYINLVIESGRSSWMYLQNLHSIQDFLHQEIPLSILLTEDFLNRKKIRGASRIHGGGFAGTIQAYIPHSVFNEYRNMMNDFFDDDVVQEILIRPVGVQELFLNIK